MTATPGSPGTQGLQSRPRRSPRLQAGASRGSFIDSVVDALDSFYTDVVQHLKAWAATPPKMREPEDVPSGTQPALVSTALSSQDRTEPPDPPETPSSEPGDDTASDRAAEHDAGLDDLGTTSESDSSEAQAENELSAASAPASQ